ncbi:UNVERIFIED_CONTAM: hypothetical protein K2H54_026503 [Gekko kuhli]
MRARSEFNLISSNPLCGTSVHVAQNDHWKPDNLGGRGHINRTCCPLSTFTQLSGYLSFRLTFKMPSRAEYLQVWKSGLVLSLWKMLHQAFRVFQSQLVGGGEMICKIHCITH